VTSLDRERHTCHGVTSSSILSAVALSAVAPSTVFPSRAVPDAARGRSVFLFVRMPSARHETAA
jgi:hypothetical protein